MKAFLIGFLLILFVALVYALFNSPHEFSPEECQGCHAGMPQPGQKSPFPMIGKIRTLCSRCHYKLIRKYSHPDEIVPMNVNVPADMPLSVDKKVTCATCHDIHAEAEWSKGVYLLRRPASGIEFCSVCHEAIPGGHIINLKYAHSAGSKYVSVDRSGSLDRLSAACISCHDASIDPVDRDKLVGSGYWMHSRELSKHLINHPVGVSYDEVRAARSYMFNHRSSLAPVKLFGGKVGCGSCHDPYSTLPGKLVMDNTGSRLCLKCHNL